MPAGSPADIAIAREARARQAHRESVKEFSHIVKALVDSLGASLVAYLGGVTETRAVRQWIIGERAAHASTRTKLQLALQVANLLATEGETEAIEAWFQGLNPALNNQSPAELIRSAEGIDLPRIGREILAAAQEFADS